MGAPAPVPARPAARRAAVPQSFQTRLAFAFVAVVVLTLTLVAPVVVIRLDETFRAQEGVGLERRAGAAAQVLVRLIEDRAAGKAVVIRTGGSAVLNPEVEKLLVQDGALQLVADTVAEADMLVLFGPAAPDTTGYLQPNPMPDLSFTARTKVAPQPGQLRDPLVDSATVEMGRTSGRQDWGLVITLSNPYTSRATTLSAITGLLLLMATIAFLVSMVVASFLAYRFATPLKRLTDASRRLKEGDLSSRVAFDELSTGTLEIRELSRQFNQMAAKLEESVAIIRGDRDRSRDFLADVSHELRTPIAATHTFIELLQGPAGEDPAARAEFLESTAGQLDRLDWLAQNLLELSKLDSGLVLLDLRPEDIRGTVESAVEQQLAAAERRGIRLITDLPDRPARTLHDPPRVGQVVGNLVGNALKFTARGGEVRVAVRAAADGGVRIEVVDTGIGIPPAELPRIFDRFYRGAQSNEARGSGSGLGLAIVKSIVDMHHGTIAVESRVGRGTRFVVTLPHDPRETTAVAAPARDADSPLAGGPGPASGTAPTATPTVAPTATPAPAAADSPDRETATAKVDISSP